MPRSVADQQSGAQAVGRALRVLDSFSLAHPQWTISELARQLQLPASTVHRLLSILCQHGFVEQNPETRVYRLGLRVFELGSVYLAQTSLLGAARPVLEALNRETGETIHLAVLDEQAREVVYVDKLDGLQPVQVFTQIGSRAPAARVSSGKVLLAWADPAAIARWIASLDDGAALDRELAVVRRRGYASSREQWRPGTASVAAPIRNHCGDVVAAVGVAMPVHRLTAEREAEIAQLVIAATSRISERLGYQPPASGGLVDAARSPPAYFKAQS